MKIVTVKIADLREAEYNPRTATDRDMEGIRDSLAEFGQVVPVVVNRHPKRMNVIVGGHQRVRAARLSGMTEVQAVIVELKPKEERDLNLRLNRTGEFDMDRLMAEFSREELEASGFGTDELDVGAGADAGEGTTLAERSWSFDLTFTSKEAYREARENHVGEDKFERTRNLIRHYAETKAK